MNTTEFLEIARTISPDRAAIIFENKTYSFAELTERSNRLADAHPWWLRCQRETGRR